MRKINLFLVFFITFIVSFIAAADNSDLYEIIFKSYNYRDGALVNLLIQNTSSELISDWDITIRLDNDAQVTKYWCCNLVQKGNTITMTPLDWNVIIPPGSIANVGFSADMPIKEGQDFTFHFGPDHSDDISIEGLVEANSDFAFEMFKQLSMEESGSNLFFSPFSISTALAMLYQGADYETKAEMGDVLNYSNIDKEVLKNSYQSLFSSLENVDEFVQLNIGNSLWIDDIFTLKSDFIAVNQEYFDADVFNVDLQTEEAVEQINGWVSDETNEIIKEVVNESAFSDDTIMCLINAIYFLGNWTVPFHPDETIETLFLNDDSTQTQIDMMVKYDDVEVARGSDYTVVRLPYGEEKVGMYCILPSEGTYIDTFIQTLTLDKFNDMKNRLVLREDFYIGLPKFKMEYGVKSIKKQLSDMGMNKMFTTSAEFPGITDESVLVSDVLHKAEIEVNEEGTEAAAVTVFIIEATSEGENTFYADRPFVFMIVDDTTESILFMGKTADLVK